MLITYKGNPFNLHDFSKEILWAEIRMINSNYLKQRILDLANLSFRYEGETMVFSDK